MLNRWSTAWVTMAIGALVLVAKHHLGLVVKHLPSGLLIARGLRRLACEASVVMTAKCVAAAVCHFTAPCSSMLMSAVVGRAENLKGAA